MHSMLPIITMTELQRDGKTVLASIKDYAVVQSHGTDRAFILSPKLGRILLESGMLEKLKQCMERSDFKLDDTMTQMDEVIGEVLRELSKK